MSGLQIHVQSVPVLIVPELEVAVGPGSNLETGLVRGLLKYGSSLLSS